MSNILDNINQPNDIKKIPPEQYPQLAKEIRSFLLQKVSKTGGHLASNLGVVELTMALHLYLDFPKDKLIWDVGHQAYVHKLLTGRKEQFANLRQIGGMSGFPKRKESACDCFDTGHSSTSISAALGFAVARDLKGEKSKVIAVIGDGALSGGMAYEALNNAARLKTNLIIILNDNNMSISENVGGMANYLGKIRTDMKYQDLKQGIEKVLLSIPKIGKSVVKKIKKSKDSIKRFVIPGMLFEDMGLTYIGPIDGHDTKQVLMALKSAGKLQGAALVHVVTKKGKGYPPAILHPAKYHGVDPFLVKTGESKVKKTGISYTEVFSQNMLSLAREYPKMVAVCAAMPFGTGLFDFKKKYPERFFDVGIAEEHAVTFSAGLAASGMKPVVAIYSTFLQRAYDQILHDVCISGHPVLFAVDRAGIVGNDGETHQGIFDISFLTSIPGLVVMAPKNKKELEAMLWFGIKLEVPAAIRYPRGTAYEGLSEFQAPLECGKSELIYKESGILLMAAGNTVETAVRVREKLKENGQAVSLINIRFLHMIDTELLEELLPEHEIVVVMEENVRTGGYGQKIAAYLYEKHYKNQDFLSISLPDYFLEHGNTEQIRKKYGLDAESIYNQLAEYCKKKKYH